MVTPHLPISEEKLQKFRKATAEDPESQLLKISHREDSQMKEVLCQNSFSPIGHLGMKSQKHLDCCLTVQS